MNQSEVSQNVDELVKQLQERLPVQKNQYLRSTRYLKSVLHDNEYSVDKAEAAICRTYKWREEIGIESILAENFDDIFIPFEYHFGGYDLQGRPILTVYAKDMGKKGSAKMHKAVKDGLKDKDRTIRWGFYMAETLLQELSEAQQRAPTSQVDSVAVIVDMKGVKLFEFLQYIPTVLPTAQPLLNTCREHYSGIMGIMYIINGSKAPAKVALQILKTQSNEIEERVKILGKKKHKWQKVLLANIAPDQLSRRFGGTLDVGSLVELD